MSTQTHVNSKPPGAAPVRMASDWELGSAGRVREAEMRSGVPNQLSNRAARGGLLGPGECQSCRRRRLPRLSAEEAARGSGEPLDLATQMTMEDGFGHDFSAVRVHTDTRAAAAADALHARAYTVGSNVVFGAGNYAPATTEGRRLLAHELAHVVQQQRGTGSISDYQSAETEAAHAGDHVATGGTATIRASGGGGLQLSPKEDDDPVLRAYLAQKQRAANPPMGSPDWVRRFQGQSESTGASSSTAAGSNNAQAHKSPAKSADPMAGFRQPATKEEEARLRQWAIERQKQEQQQKMAQAAAARAQQEEAKRKQEEAARAEDFRKQHEKSQQTPPLFLSMLGPGFVQAYYRNPSGSIQDPLLRQQSELTTAATAGHGALGTTAVAAGTGVIAAATTILVGSLAAPAAVAISLEALAGSAALAPVVSVVFANPLAATEVALFGAGVVISIAEVGGIQNFAAQLSTPEGAARLALDLVVLHGTIRSNSGAPQTVTGKGKVQPAPGRGINVRIVEPLAPANDVVPPSGPIGGAAGGRLDTGSGRTTPPTTNLTSRRSAEENAAVQRRLQNARVQQAGKAPDSEPATQAIPAQKQAEAAGQKKIAVGQTHSGDTPAGAAGIKRPEATNAKPATPAPVVVQPSMDSTSAPTAPAPKSSQSGVAPSVKPAAAPTAPPSPQMQQKLTDLEKRRAEKYAAIAEVEKELGRKGGEVGRLAGEIPKAREVGRLAGEIPKAREAERAGLVKQREAAEAERNSLQDRRNKLQAEADQLKHEIDDLKRPSPESPQAAGLRFEEGHTAFTGVKKNVTGFKTSFPDADAPDGRRIPDFLPKLAKDGGYEAAATPSEAEFVADSKLVGKNITLTQQIRGFVELAKQSKQRVLVLMTEPGTTISPSVQEFANSYGVRVRQMTRPR